MSLGQSDNTNTSGSKSHSTPGHLRSMTIRKGDRKVTKVQVSTQRVAAHFASSGSLSDSHGAQRRGEEKGDAFTIICSRGHALFISLV
jgi:hypothetical protein